jgi:hypothetical protein
MYNSTAYSPLNRADSHVTEDKSYGLSRFALTPLHPTSALAPLFNMQKACVFRDLLMNDFVDPCVPFSDSSNNLILQYRRTIVFRVFNDPQAINTQNAASVTLRTSSRQVDGDTKLEEPMLRRVQGFSARYKTLLWHQNASEFISGLAQTAC